MGPSIRAERVVFEPFPEQSWCPVHERDIADVAAAALLEDGHHAVAYDLRGPQMLTRREQVAAIAAAIGEDVRVEVVSRERARELYLAQGGFASAYANFLLGFEDYSGNAPGSTTAPQRPARVLDRPGRTFAQWAGDHAADFR